MITPGREEGGMRQSEEVIKAKNDFRDGWRKLVESEERLKFFKRMVGWNLEVREIEHLGEDLNNKFRSERMRNAKSEKEVIGLIMKLKLKDERKYQRERKHIRNNYREKLMQLTSKQQLGIILSTVNRESKRWRKLERSKYNKKIEHIKNIAVSMQI